MKRIEQEIQRREGMSRSEFRREYLYPELPVVLQDFSDGWSARTRWPTGYLVERFGDYPFRGYYHPDALYTAWKRMRLQTTLREVVEGGDPRTFIASDFVPECPYLIEDIDVPHLLDPSWVQDEATFWVQPAGHRTGLHWDSFNSILSVISGRKRVRLFSPEQFARLYPCPVTDWRNFSMGSWSQIDVFAPDFSKFPDARDAAYYEVEVEAGETLLIPRHWWHCVENLGAEDGTSTIAVSFFVGPQGKPEALFFRDRRVIAGLSVKVGTLSGYSAERHAHAES